MTVETIRKRYPVGRIVWIRSLGCWLRGQVRAVNGSGPTITIATDQGFEIYVHAGCAHEIRVREPYVWSR